MTHRHRPPSPRRFVDPMRSSTGMIFNTSLDIPHHNPARGSVDSIRSRGSVSRAPEAQLISSTTYRGGDPTRGGVPVSKTDYQVPIRQRRNTLDPDAARLDPARLPLNVMDPSRQSLNVVVPSSPSRSSHPIVSSDRARSPLAKPYRESDSYLVPVSSTSGRNHRRIFSADGENVANLAPHDRERPPRPDRQYRDVRARDQRVGQQLARYKPPEYEDNYSYTTPRKEFEEDSAARAQARLRPRRESYDRRERPASTAGLEGHMPPSRNHRDEGPPVSSRGFDRISQGRSSRADDDIDLGRRYSVKDYPTREKEEAYDVPQRRASQRAPVSLHQDRDRDRDRDEGYTSYREDDRERHRRPRYDEDPVDYRKYESEPRRHHKREEEAPSGAGLGAAAGLAGAAGLAAAGIASHRHKDNREKDYDDDEVSRRDRKERERRARDLDSRDDDRPDDRKHRDRRLDILSDDNDKARDRRDRSGRDLVDSSADTSDRDRERHKHQRHRKHRGEDREKDDDSGSSSSSSDSRVDPLTREPDAEDRHRRKEERHRRRREERERDRHGFLPDEAPVADTPLNMEGPDLNRPRRVEIVPPVVAKEPEVPVKSILKKRTIPFPEDPNAIREGVAPLKDAGKKGVPPGARWTKIDRRLVNPAALEEAHERFEERPEYVIVLRVLTKEEIQDFATKTQEIRDARYEAERRDRHRRREEEEIRKMDGHGSNDDDEYEKKKAPLQIEPPPPQQNPRLADPRFNPQHVMQQAQQAQQAQGQPQGQGQGQGAPLQYA